MSHRSEHRLRSTLPTLVLVVAAAAGTAQQQFVDLAKQHIPRETGAVESQALIVPSVQLLETRLTNVTFDPLR